MRNYKTKSTRIIAAIVTALAGIVLVGVFAYIYFLFFPGKLRVSEYTIQTNLEQPLRIVQLTDLHNEVFGEKNEKLIQLVAEQDPDMILMTGDMINRDDESLSVIKELVRCLAEIAPVYYGYGNHESTWEKHYGEQLHNQLESCGAVVLNSDYVDLELNGNELRIGGFRGFYGYTHMDGQNAEQKEIDQAFFDNFVDTERYRILLNHIPTQWLDWHAIDKWRTGLVFSGHYHGGQIVLPLIGPLYAPYVGWFPEYANGCYEGSQSTCVLSSGLGNERNWLPRVWNPPEIVVVDLVCSGI